MAHQHHGGGGGCTDCGTCCSSCANACRQTLAHCQKKGGEHADPAHLRLLADCADVCHACSLLCSRDSQFHAKMCALCAEVCAACAKSCEKLAASDPQMKACADACRKCAEDCGKMAAK